MSGTLKVRINEQIAIASNMYEYTDKLKRDSRVSCSLTGCISCSQCYIHDWCRSKGSHILYSVYCFNNGLLNKI